MLHGENIVCFAKDWSEDPTSNNHVMRLLARDNQVLWLNSIATRTPSLTSRRDLGKIVTKLKSFARGPVHVDAHLDVYTPIVLPFPHSALATAANEQLLRASIKVLRRQRHMDEFQLWSFLPTAARYAGRLGESLLVYYITDEWAHFSGLDRAKILAMERDLCERADIVFATARTLVERKRVFNPETHLASHGVDHAHFARALDPATVRAPEVADLRGPVLGFVGLIQDWVDLALLEHLARYRQDWTLVVIGKALVDTSRLAALPNVRLLGRKPYETLPSYCAAFDVALIPFTLNELTRNVNPIKLREYLSAGLPVVSTDLPEVTAYASEQGALTGAVAIGRSPEEFTAAVERALAADSPAARAARSDAMRAETWEQQVAKLGEHITRVKAKQRR
jgi:glycosyltransferase involved in cell wall biosynthesis